MEEPTAQELGSNPALDDDNSSQNLLSQLLFQCIDLLLRLSHKKPVKCAMYMYTRRMQSICRASTINEWKGQSQLCSFACYAGTHAQWHDHSDPVSIYGLAVLAPIEYICKSIRWTRWTRSSYIGKYWKAVYILYVHVCNILPFQYAYTPNAL